MEIQIPLKPPTQQLLASVKNSPLALKLNQQIEVKVLNTDAFKNSIALQFGDKTLEVQANQTLNPNNLPSDGAALKLQVVKLTPILEFKILNDVLTNQKSALNTHSGSNTGLGNPTQQPASTPELRLLLANLPVATQLKPAATPTLHLTANTLPAESTPTTTLGNSLSLTPSTELAKAFTPGQFISIKIIDLSAEAIRFQLLSDTTDNTETTATGKPVVSLGTDATNLPDVDNLATPSATKNIPATTLLTVALNQFKINVSQLDQKALDLTGKACNLELQLKPGLTLHLEVKQSNNQLEFNIVNPHDAIQQNLKISETLVQLLPQQITPTLLLNQLIQHIPELLSHETLPEALQRIAQEIIQNLPKAAQLTDPQTLKQAVVDSGIFLEAKLPQLLTEMPVALQKDFKLTLLKFLVEIKEHLQIQPDKEGLENSKATNDLTVLKELQQKTEGSIAKLVLDQLSSLAKDDSPKQVWNLEIPFLTKTHADKIAIEIEQDHSHSSNPDDDPSWSVTLTLTPPLLGTIHCKVTYIDKCINTYFRSETPQTLEMLQHHLEQLRQQFEAAGLKSGFMNVQEGHFKKDLSQKMSQRTLFNQKV